MAAVALRPIHKTRLKNLNDLIKARFKGNASEAARAIERSHTFMWQLLNEYRSIGEETARHIEEKLKLGENALDHKLERTRALIAHTGDGSTAQYRVVPCVALDALDVKGKVFRPCPDERAGERTFCTEVLSEAMVELQVGDQVFADPDEDELQNRKLYIVTLKGKPAIGRILQAKRLSTTRWVFVATGELARREKPIDADDVRIAGRVILVVRTLR